MIASLLDRKRLRGGVIELDCLQALYDQICVVVGEDRRMIRMILSLLMMVALQSRQGWPSRESSLYCVRLSGCSMGLACRWYSCGASVEIQWPPTLRKRRTLHQRWGDTVRYCLIVRTTRRRDLIERDREVLQRSIAPAHSTSRTVLERSHGKTGLYSSKKGVERLEAEDQ